MIKKLEDDLDALFEECKPDGWAGHGSKAISLETLQNAKALLELFPPDLPAPDIGAEPDGCITFEWRKPPGIVISISVDRNAEIHFGFIGKNDKVIGAKAGTVGGAFGLLAMISRTIESEKKIERVPIEKQIDDIERGIQKYMGRNPTCEHCGIGSRPFILDRFGDFAGSNNCSFCGWTDQDELARRKLARKEKE